MCVIFVFFFFQAEDGIRDLVRSRGLGDVYKRQDKGMVAKVEKAIRESGLGINPQLNGTIIMLPIPELNEERRRELTKVASQYAEHARVAIRNLRRDGMDQIKKAKGNHLSEDDAKFWEGEVQEMTDKYIKLVDHTLETKQQEIMQV